MLQTLVSFAGIAVLLSLTPGPATALVVRSAAVHGRREALLTTIGNSTGILLWALASVLGIRALRGRGADGDPTAPSSTARTAYGNGLMTSFANPKLAVFFVALFPQFVRDGQPVLPTTLAMALLLIAVDLVYFSLLALVVARTRHAIAGSSLARRIERVTGAVMIALGVRVALEQR